MREKLIELGPILQRILVLETEINTNRTNIMENFSVGERINSGRTNIIEICSG